MSTQHPDNAYLPEWARGEVIAGDDEIYETYYVYSVLDIREQMWDWEGKDADPHVVRKLFENFPEFFEENVLGRDVYLTYRIPNPNVEEDERKKFAEALETIPSSYDIARRFYGEKASPPIFEVILPLTRSCLDLLRVVNYYRKVVVGKESMKVVEEDVSIMKWIGDFHPKNIEVIPLVEDKDSLLFIEKIIECFIKAVKPAYLRVFIARSDPALNYGLFVAVMLSKIALNLLKRVSEKTGIRIFPIIGAGSPPFRGHLTPSNVEEFIREYGGYWTTTIQSAFKYDYGRSESRRAIEKLNNSMGQLDSTTSELSDFKKKLLSIVEKFSDTYKSRIESLHRIINALAEFVPRRRARKLHIGLFGYSRINRGISLPRAIKFTAALYSLGIPPEVLGLTAIHSLTEDEQDFLEELYVNLKHDLRTAASMICWDNINMLLSDGEVYERVTRKYGLAEGLTMVVNDIEVLEQNFGIRSGSRTLSERRYSNIVNNILLSFAEGDREEVRKYVLEAAKIRKFLG